MGGWHRLTRGGRPLRDRWKLDLPLGSDELVRKMGREELLVGLVRVY
jgi:hypothetical protein